jgi:hypothetical protein
MKQLKWVYEEMKRFIPVIALVIAAVVLGAVNATAFAYRWIQGTVTVAGPTAARGAACVGFYSSAAQSGINLPTAGTNYNAKTYGDNKISVTSGQEVCEWTVGTTIYYLYEGITVKIPITVGSWYIKDFYGFGYYGGYGGTTPVYVYIKVEQPIVGPITVANLTLYNATSGAKVAVVDLKTVAMVEPITLNPGNALQLDLFINATAATTATFKVGFYVSQEREAPR